MLLSPLECNHPLQEITTIIVKCLECQTHIHYTVGGHFADLCNFVRQGKLDLQTALQDVLTEQQIQILSTITPCKHRDIKEVDCKCNKGISYQCNDCGLTLDDKSRFNNFLLGSRSSLKTAFLEDK